MEKIIRKYGVIVLLYLIIIVGAFLLSSRLRYMNNLNSNSNTVILANK